MATQGYNLRPIQVQPYCWEFEDLDDEMLQIRVWCLDHQSRPHLVRIENYYSYCYIELPTYASGTQLYWNDGDADLLHQKLARRLTDHQLLPFQHHHFCRKPKLYYYQNGKTFPFLKVCFRAHSSLNALRRVLSYPFEVADGIKAKLNMWESEISPIRKLLTERGVSYSGWFHCNGRTVNEFEKMSNLEHEWIVDWSTISAIPTEICSSWHTSPSILAFDIESYSDRPKAFPDKWNPRHHAYMVSCIFQKVGSSERLRYGVVMGKCNSKSSKLPPNTCLFEVETEEELVRMLASIIQYHKPQIITGHNISSFDWDYLDSRLQLYNEEWPEFGYLNARKPRMWRDSWKSSGYGQNDVAILGISGIITVDTYTVVKRDFKMDSYSLNSVAQFFVGKSKHDITPQRMFQIYEANMEATRMSKTLQEHQDPDIISRIRASEEEMTEVMCYCIQDSELVLDVLDKLHFWIASCEMAAVAGVNIEDLYTRGQQARCLSQLYNLATLEGIVLDSRTSPSDAKFKGGHVREPIKGIHDNVITLDFTSLYPSIIIGFNICYTTLVPPYLENRIENEKCNVIEISEDQQDSKQAPATSVSRSFKYVKEPQGILPRLVSRLIEERNKVKQQIKTTTDPLQLVVLDKRQLALKVMANSFFGFVGVQVGGKRPLLEAAESITSKGRWLIGKVEEYLRHNYQASVVYGDTDSAMVVLPQIKDARECQEWGFKLAKEISTIFPPPVKMEFEKACRMLLLDKKMYVGLYISKDGTFVEKNGSLELLIKGVLLARRDNCKWARNIYRKLVTMALLRQPLTSTIKCLISEVRDLLSNKVEISDLAIVKTLGSNYTNENYQMKVFADNLRRLGRPVQPGDRLFYLIVEGSKNSLLGTRMVTPEIFTESLQTTEPYKIDHLYYLEHMLENPIDKLISTAYQEELEVWSSIQYRPTTKHKYLGLDTPVRLISSMLTHGNPIENLEQLLSMDPVQLLQQAQQ